LHCFSANAISLAITNADRGNTDNRFMTRRAVEKAGLEIKESAKAMQISYLRPRESHKAVISIPSICISNR
jgi:hypothetical protein